MSLLKTSAIVILTGILYSCSIYKSADRKDFESDYSAFNITNLKISHCSQISIKANAQYSKLVTVQSDDSTHETFILWEHKINNASVFETDNLNGTYCLYENI